MGFFRHHQLSIMLFLSGICSILALLSFFMHSIPKKRRRALILMEVYAAILLILDRYAYIYRGDVSVTGYWMVRIANFSVYFFSLFILHAFNLYASDLYRNEGGLKKVPLRLYAVEVLFFIGLCTLTVSAFTGFYYDFDEFNRYYRAKGFIISYIIPLSMMTLQLSVIVQYYWRLVRNIRIPLLLFAIIPFVAIIIQIFTYGISLQNIAMVGEVVLLYIFVLVDMNKTVERTNKIEVDFLKEEQKTMRIMFEQTATALANAIDAKDEYTHGHSRRVAEYARKIAEKAHKDEKFCSDVYYAGLLHDVGKIGIPGSIINKNSLLSDDEIDEVKKHPVIGRQILSSISESPYLSIAANFHHERYDGQGYPEGLKGEDIPEIARIIAVADSYDAMSSKRCYRDILPQQKVREEIVKGMGTQFDPYFAKLMLRLIDSDVEYQLKEHEEIVELSGKAELCCEEFHSEKSAGILLTQKMTKIHFHFKSNKEFAGPDSIPSFIIFDSLDARVHESENKRRDLLYIEYGNIWIDGRYECLVARKFKADITDVSSDKKSDAVSEYVKGMDCDIEAVRIEDHALIVLKTKLKTITFTIALPDCSRYCYLALTGEHCVISKVEIHNESEDVPLKYIPRIAPEINFIDGPEGDIPNLQINGWRSAATEGIPLKNSMKISFHTKSLPTARLIWHCPFVTIFYSDDKKVRGAGFKEFVLIRLDGENWESDEYTFNTILINKTRDFEGWEKWKEKNKAGMDCHISIKRDGNKITVFTENEGIAIKSVSILKKDIPCVYVSLTGDQCVLTNIKISD